MLPEYAQARKSMWDAINPQTGKKRLDTIVPEILRASTNQQEMRITLKVGSTIQLVGADNYDSLVGSPPVGLVFSEYAISNPSAWAYLMPIVEENNGWAGFNSTPRGKNHFYRLCLMAQDNHDWFYDCRDVTNTGVFADDQLQRIREELHAQYGEDFGEAMYQQEYMVSFDAAQIGAIWADCIAKLQANGAIRELPYNDRYPVNCVYDLGNSDATAIWFFQVIGRQINVIDYHESNHRSIEYYVNILTDKPYLYSSQWLPHDAFAAHLAAGGKTIAQQFIELTHGRLGKVKRVPNVSIEQGIQAGRATFPACSFDSVKCQDGLEALRHYHHKYDDEKKCFTKAPEHDWSSHAADAWRYLSLVWREAHDQPAPIPVDHGLINKSIQSIRMGDITKQHLDRMRARREQ